jgi:hypothetical protein
MTYKLYQRSTEQSADVYGDGWKHTTGVQSLPLATLPVRTNVNHPFNRLKNLCRLAENGDLVSVEYDFELNSNHITQCSF